MVRSRLLGSVVGAALMIGVGGAQAAPTTALFLAMDGSGSISAANFTTQISGYVSALNTFFANNPTAFGQVAIGASIFGFNINQFFNVQTIVDATVLNSLTTAIGALDPGRGGINTGATAIGDAVNAAAASLLAFETLVGSDMRLLIDVTTDGQNNVGANPTTAAANAVASGINSVNCLGIGAGASCAWVGTSGIDFGTVTFDTLGTALTNKIQTEVVGVPEPMTMAIFGLGLAGLGLMRRRAA